MKKQALLIPVFLTILLVIAFYDVVFLNKTFKVTTANSQALPTGAYGQENNKPKFIPVNGTDSPVMEEPVYEFIKRNLQKGILPLWNPHQACGYPLIGMIEVGMFYPLMFILYLFPEFFAWDIMILARLLVAGCFTYWFMRYLPSCSAGRFYYFNTGRLTSTSPPLSFYCPSNACSAKNGRSTRRFCPSPSH
ncbi:MAG: hypothetical protein WC450_01220 [Candidatus Omnitrophota bacterium]